MRLEAVMGASHSLEVFEDQESVSEAGTKSIISASLDHLEPPISEKEIIDEFIQLNKYPIDPVTEVVLKAVEVTETTADDFVVKVVLDGKKLDSFGQGRGDGMDRIRNWKRIIVDRRQSCVTKIDYVDEVRMGDYADVVSDAEAFCRTRMYVLDDPTRLEFCVNNGMTDERYASAAVRDILYGWTDVLVGSVHAAKTAKVKVTTGAPSIKDSGAASNVSGPLDEHVSYANFFPAMVGIIKDNLSGVPGAEVTDINSGEFVSDFKLTEKGMAMRTLVKFSDETGDIEQQLFQDGKLARTTRYAVHKDPFQVEGWVVDSEGSRLATVAMARQTQRIINRAIDKGSSWFG